MASAALEIVGICSLVLTSDDGRLVSGENSQSFPDLNNPAAYSASDSYSGTLSFEDVRDWQS